jgi:hypothetical protein
MMHYMDGHTGGQKMDENALAGLIKAAAKTKFQFLAEHESKPIDEQIDLLRKAYGITKKEAREYVHAYLMNSNPQR